MTTSDIICELEKDFRFEAAHYIEPAQAKGTSLPDSKDAPRNFHGHSFLGTVRLTGEPDPISGKIRDLQDIDRVIAETIQPLDHTILNDVEGLSHPTIEHIAEWVFDRLAPKLPGLTCVEIGRPSCGERARIRRRLENDG